MRYLTGRDNEEAQRHIEYAIEQARKSTCLKSKCGSVLIQDDEVIGRGYNSPPGNLESQRRCLKDRATYNEKVSDKSCCVHAEERAIMDALRNNPNKIQGSRLYFIRLDKEGNKSFSKKPWCTICSKMALDAGVKEFVLWHEEGISVYGTEEYNSLSFNYEKI